MGISTVIKRQMNKSNGRVKITKLPTSKRPTAESLAKLEREIRVQVRQNENMHINKYII